MRTSGRPAVLAGLLCPVTIAVVFGCQLLVGVGALSVVAYALWSCAWWALGFAVVRSRTTFDRFTQLTLGAAAGIIGQLCWWAVCQSVLRPSLTPLGAAAATVAAAVLLRRPAPSADRKPAGPPPYALLTWAATTLWGAARAVAFASRQTLPGTSGTHSSTMYQDLYWHLGLAGELTHSLLPQTPQADVGRLNYHWLSNAYAAVGSLGTGRPLPDIALRLWVVPVVALTTALCLAVGHRLARNWVAGSVAAALLVSSAGLIVIPWAGAAPLDAFIWVSPSQVFGLVFTLVTLFLIIPLLRSSRVPIRSLPLLVVLAFLCSGAKSSILPVFLGGSLLTTAVFVRRAPQRRAASVVAAICLLGIGLALPLFAGGSAGSRLRMFSSARMGWPYAAFTHTHRGPGHGPFLPPGLTSLGAVVVLLGALVMMTMVYAIAAASMQLGRIWRQDPLPTFLAGSILAALAAYELIDHTGGSQAYFPLGALPLVALLGGWGISVALERSDDRRRLLLAAAGAAAAALLVRKVASAVHPAPRALPWIMALLLLAVVLVVLVVLVILPRTTRAPLLTALVVGACLTNTAVEQNLTRTLGAPFAAPLRQQHWTVLAAESSAAGWLRDHSGDADLVATNVHCRDVRTTPGCVASAFWVSGFSSRRMLVESWSYTDGAQRRAGQNGLPAVRQPYPDQATYALNERAFKAPDAATLKTLRNKGVRWLFADSRASAVSPGLASLAEPVHHSGPVTVYRLR